jgi:hypothetical protein
MPGLDITVYQSVSAARPGTSAGKVPPRCAGRCRRPLSSRAAPARPTTSTTSKSKPGSATTGPASRSPANCSNAATSASRTLNERSCRKTLTSAVLCERWRLVGPPASALRGWASNRPGAALADDCRGERPRKRPGVTAWSAAFARHRRRRAAKQRLASASRSALRAAPGVTAHRHWRSITTRCPQNAATSRQPLPP